MQHRPAQDEWSDFGGEIKEPEPLNEAEAIMLEEEKKAT